MSILRSGIEAAASEDKTPLHMPGHKRNLERLPGMEGLPAGLDMTELESTDDLHAAEGLLKKAMKRTAALYGADRTWYLVNGSTCGILAGIRASAPSGSTVLCARNCHRSVFHALELCRLKAVWLMPEYIPEYEIYGSLPPERVREALHSCPECRAVILTSPTYEGIVSDIGSIAEICHSRGIPLIVDEAHGAHLGIQNPRQGEDSTFFPEGAVKGGADIVVQSPHKTLTSLTQSAWMHLRRGLVDESEVSRQLDVFETSSPSYPLMISLDECTELFQNSGQEIMNAWQERLEGFRRVVSVLGTDAPLMILGVSGFEGEREGTGIYALDPSKILIRSMDREWTGKRLYERLESRYGIICEMYCGMNMLAMTGPGDRDDALEKLTDALIGISEEMISCRDGDTASDTARGCPDAGRDAGVLCTGNLCPFGDMMPESECTICEALENKRDVISLEDSEGLVAAEYVFCYPPGVPLVLPGERISLSLIKKIRSLNGSGTRIHYSFSGDDTGNIACLIC